MNRRRRLLLRRSGLHRCLPPVRGVDAGIVGRVVFALLGLSAILAVSVRVLLRRLLGRLLKASISPVVRLPLLLRVAAGRARHCCRRRGSRGRVRRDSPRLSWPLRRRLVGIHDLGGLRRLGRYGAAILGRGRTRVGRCRRVRRARGAHLARAGAQGAVRHGRGLGLPLLLNANAFQNLVGDSHGHTTEVRHQVNAMSVTREATFCAQLANMERKGDRVLVPEHFLQFFLPNGKI